MYKQEADHHKRHMLDRMGVREVRCTICGTRQPVSSRCCHCEVQFAAYCCLKCNLFDDDTSKAQFHCDQCGICRVGGRENFFHCQLCGCCYSNNLQGQHICVANNLNQACCVCSDFLFDSTGQISVLQCGHTLHRDCHGLLLSSGVNTCPICQRTPADVEGLKAIIQDAMLKFPQNEEEDVVVHCLECLSRSKTKYHVLGQSCAVCGSFNTRI